MIMGRTLKFCYRMELVFSDNVRQHQFTLRMIPQTDERQKITECSVLIRPECEVSEDVDAYGNKYVYGVIEAEHTDFQVEISGTAQVDSSRPEKASGEEQIYRYPSRYTKPGDAVTDYYRAHKKDGAESDADYAERLMHEIYRDMKYQKGVTGIETTAEEALRAKAGVCQDYAHIMIAILRMAGIPARYAVGMMKGEGFSHAWVEAAVSGNWIGYDPTNDHLVDDTYIRISHGRDYQDCIVNRGFFSGCVTQEQKINVVVSEV
jgi:transglutaminase-like putative cysteine protease